MWIIRKWPLLLRVVVEGRRQAKAIAIMSQHLQHVMGILRAHHQGQSIVACRFET